MNTKEIVKVSGFEFREWASYSVELRSKINREESINYTDSSNKSNHTRNGFGINWDLKADTITLDFHELVNELFLLPMTKRSALKISAKIFESLGLIWPITKQFETLFQIICTKKLIGAIIVAHLLQNYVEKKGFFWKKKLCLLQNIHYLQKKCFYT